MNSLIMRLRSIIKCGTIRDMDQSNYTIQITDPNCLTSYLFENVFEDQILYFLDK